MILNYRQQKLIFRILIIFFETERVFLLIRHNYSCKLLLFRHLSRYLSQNAKRASARKDTGLDQSLFSVQLFRLRINIIKVCKGANKGHLGGLDKVFKIRDHHHRIHRQILRPNEGLILILAQS